MCRFSVYKGKGIFLGDLIVKPENSLICQSRDASYFPGVVDRTHIRNIRVNGDGFGVAFYSLSPEVGSCLFKFVTPAWSNKNLINLGQFVHSPLIMAHIRAATTGRDPLEPQSVSIENCHPFKRGRFTFMHNGGIPRFSRVRRRLIDRLRDDCFQLIDGSTDSEYIFALFLSLLPDWAREGEREPRHAGKGERAAESEGASDEELVSVLANALELTISAILSLCAESGVTEACSLNMVLTDGVHVLATRFRGSCHQTNHGQGHGDKEENGDKEEEEDKDRSDCPPSLYFNFGSDFSAEEGTFLNRGQDDSSCEIVISSAPLCRENFAECSEGEGEGEELELDSGKWILAPKNSMLVCTGDETDCTKIKSISLRPIIATQENWINTLKQEELSKLNFNGTLSSSNNINRNEEVNVNGIKTPLASRNNLDIVNSYTKERSSSSCCNLMGIDVFPRRSGSPGVSSSNLFGLASPLSVGGLPSLNKQYVESPLRTSTPVIQSPHSILGLPHTNKFSQSSLLHEMKHITTNDNNSNNNNGNNDFSLSMNGISHDISNSIDSLNDSKIENDDYDNSPSPFLCLSPASSNDADRTISIDKNVEGCSISKEILSSSISDDRTDVDFDSDDARNTQNTNQPITPTRSPREQEKQGGSSKSASKTIYPHKSPHKNKKSNVTASTSTCTSESGQESSFFQSCSVASAAAAELRKLANNCTGVPPPSRTIVHSKMTRNRRQTEEECYDVRSKVRLIVEKALNQASHKCSENKDSNENSKEIRFVLEKAAIEAAVEAVVLISNDSASTKLKIAPRIHIEPLHTNNHNHTHNTNNSNNSKHTKDNDTIATLNTSTFTRNLIIVFTIILSFVLIALVHIVWLLKDVLATRSGVSL